MIMAGVKLAKQKVTLSLQAPEAQSVTVVADFTDWEKSPIALKKNKKGVWTKSLSLPSGMYEYRFMVDGQWQDDPACTHHVPNPFGSQNCVLVILEPEPSPALVAQPSLSMS